MRRSRLLIAISAAPDATRGKARCLLAQGTVFHCDCALATSLNVGGMCEPDEGCTPTTCAGKGQCNEDDDDVVSCQCSAGSIGENCDPCDEANGFFSDGFGACSDEPEVCRAEQGCEDLAAFLADAEVSLEFNAY